MIIFFDFRQTKKRGKYFLVYSSGFHAYIVQQVFPRRSGRRLLTRS